MPLQVGSRLATYEILAVLGEGGMGRVYRARDERLGRDVAIKIMTEPSVADADRRKRFERESRLLAALNHPHIAGIYGIVDTPQGEPALVLELVDGPTLADRIALGPLPLNEALSIAAQIADALDAAHERGVVHRDLKPANIKLTADGEVKVLDFGLAKLASAEPDSANELNLANSPTITATRVGVLLGTAAYMSPEQARGLPVDKRSDIWSFGCVLYEMLTGRAVFGGGTVTDVLAAIVERQPDLNALPPETPRAIRRLLARCLEKDRRQRLRDSGDLRADLADAVRTAPAETPATAGRRPATVLLATALVAGILVGGVTAWSVLRNPRVAGRAPDPRVLRLVITEPEQFGAVATPMGSPCSSLDCGQRAIDISPDGARIVYAGINVGRQQLYRRDLDRFETAPIAGTDGAIGATFSPDGRSVAFIADRKLKTVGLDGGVPQVLTDFVEGSGVSWTEDGAILFTPGVNTGIWRVPASGGSPTALTKIEGTDSQHRFPEMLPGGRVILYSTATGVAEHRVVVQSLESGTRRVLATGVSPHYTNGYLTYVDAGTLFAVPFDRDRLELTGTPIALVRGIRMIAGAPQVAFSAAGSMIYVVGEPQSFTNSLVWIDVNGREEPTGATGRAMAQPRISPDGQRVAVAMRSGTLDLWLFELARGTWSRVTYDKQSTFPVWQPDGKAVTYASGQQGAMGIFTTRIGASVGEPRVTGDRANIPLSWSPDAHTLAYVSVDPLTAQDIWIYSTDAAEKTRPFLQTRFREGAPQFSPDGRWVAYVSDESGQNEVYVRPYPGPGEKWTISTDSGTEPVWARRSGQIFYRKGNALMVVDTTLSPAFSAGKPRQIFERAYDPSGSFWPNYDVTPDGKRLLMVKPDEVTVSPVQINVVLNWFDELAAQVKPDDRAAR
jgi:serine/threonine-protein kinase